MLNVDELLDHAVEHARKVLVGKPKAALMPTWLIQVKDQTMILGTPWDGDNDKDIVITAMRMLMKLRDVQSYSFMSEAWKATESLDNPIGLMPRDREDKVEVLIINACDRKGGKIRFYEIKRGPDAVVTDLVLDIHGDDDRFSGRLYNLLAQ